MDIITRLAQQNAVQARRIAGVEQARSEIIERRVSGAPLTVEHRWYDTNGASYVTQDYPPSCGVGALQPGRIWWVKGEITGGTLIHHNYQTCMRLTALPATCPSEYTGKLWVGNPESGETVEIDVTAGVADTYAGAVRVSHPDTGEAVDLVLSNGRVTNVPETQTFTFMNPTTETQYTALVENGVIKVWPES